MASPAARDAQEIARRPRACHGIDQHAGVHHAGRVDGGLCGAQRVGEEVRTLAVVLGSVHATHCVVVGDRAAHVEHCLGGGVLHVLPHRDLGALAADARPRVVRRGPVGIGVGEPARQHRLVPEHVCGASCSTRSRTYASNSGQRSHVIAVSNVSATRPRLVSTPSAGADERVAPHAHRALATGGCRAAVAHAHLVVGDLTATPPSDVDCLRRCCGAGRGHRTRSR